VLVFGLHRVVREAEQVDAGLDILGRQLKKCGYANYEAFAKWALT